MYTNDGYLPMFMCVPVCAYVCVCEYRRGLYLAKDDAFNPEPHSSARCPESWRKFALGTREGSSHRLPHDWKECCAFPSPGSPSSRFGDKIQPVSSPYRMEAFSEDSA